MKDSGITRKMDSLGRLVLPKELRRQLEIEENDYLQIFTENNQVIIRKAQCNCVFCNRTNNLIDFHEKKICQECVEKLKEIS